MTIAIPEITEPMLAAEAEQQYEHLPREEQVLRWLNYAGNDERKLCILMALDRAETPLTEARLMGQLGNLAGKHLPGAQAGPTQFCEQSLSAIGAVRAVDGEILRFGTNPQTTNAYEITKQGREFGVAFAGALLSWSHGYNNLSLAKVFGNTAGKYDLRAPLATYWAMYELATSPETPKSPSIAYIAEHVEMDNRTRSNAVRRLDEAGLVDIESAFENNRRTFRIIQPEYLNGERKRPFERLNAETKLLFNTFRIADAVKKEWTVDEFFKLAVALHPYAEPEVLKKARSGLYRAFAPSTTYLKGVVEDVSGRQFEGITKVSLKPGVDEAVTELVSIIDGFCSDDVAVIASGQKEAERIATDPEMFANLYEKAYLASNLANRDPAMAARLLQIAEKAGKLLTTKELRERYAQQHGRRFSSRTVLNALQNLVAEGKLQQTESCVSVTNGSKRAVYGVAPELSTLINLD